MNEFFVPALALLGLAFGALLTWTAYRWKVMAAAAESAAQIELAQLRERIRAAEESRETTEESQNDLKRQIESLRDEISSEREKAANKFRAANEDILRISSEASQKGQAALSLTQQVSELEVTNRDLAGKLEHTAQSLATSNELKAALEEQNHRIPDLVRDLADATVEQSRLNEQLTLLRESNSAGSAQLDAEQTAHALVRGALTQEKAQRQVAEAEVGRLNGELTELRTKLDAEREGATEKLALLVNAKEALTDQFKSLATDILEEKSKRFAEQNQATLGQLLDPLRTQLTEFKGKVEEVYVQEGKDRSALSEQVRQLVGLNQSLSQDAKNLTLALKGSAKTQGNWGELVLERVLEASGLRKGFEYHVQESQQREDGSRAQADVIINLPEDRRLVVDAKVSLVAYEAHITAETDEERAQAVRRHLDSVKTHIKGLSAKEYQALYGLKSLDFVLMFIPIEPAFMMAVTHDNELFMDAWNRNVLLVSPSTLLFVVRTVAHLWRQEQQSRNSQDIAKRGAELYDRLVGFVEDLQSVGNRLNQAQISYDNAFKKLTTNKGNVIRQAEMLRDLGVKPTKSLAIDLLDRSTSEDDSVVLTNIAALAPPESSSHPDLATSDDLQAGASAGLPRTAPEA
jgi:DNA recombination protein RmuC